MNEDTRAALLDHYKKWLGDLDHVPSPEEVVAWFVEFIKRNPQ